MYHLNRSNKFVIRMSKDTYQVLKKHLQVRQKTFSSPCCKRTQGCKHLPPLALKFPNPYPCTFFVCPQHSLLFIILFTIPRYSALLQNAFVTKLLQYLRCCSQAIIFYLSCTSYLPLHFLDFPTFQSGKINGAHVKLMKNFATSIRTRQAFFSVILRLSQNHKLRKQNRRLLHKTKSNFLKTS